MPSFDLSPLGTGLTVTKISAVRIFFFQGGKMAKIKELSDPQLEKAIFKYSETQKNSPSEKSQNILKHLIAERSRRAQTVKVPEGENLSQLAKIAEAAVNKKKAQQLKKEQRLKIQVKKGPGPSVDTKLGNSLLIAGLSCGSLGALLLLDHHFLYWIPSFTGQSFLYFSLIIIGVGLSKTASFLTDDNR